MTDPVEKVPCEYCGKLKYEKNTAHFLSRSCKRAKNKNIIDEYLINEITAKYPNTAISRDKIVAYIARLSVDEKINLKSNLMFLSEL